VKIKKLDVDSSVLKENIFEIIDFEKNYKDFVIKEPDFIKDKHPDYIQISIDSSKINLIHFFENLGFRFSEFKIFRSMKLDNILISKSYLYPFDCKIISNTKELKQVLSICLDSRFDDRYSNDDHYLHEISLKRINAFIKKSFQKKDEFLIAYFNSSTDEIIGFQTGKFISPNHVILYMNSIISGLDEIKYREICDHLLLNWLKQEKVNIIDAYSTGSNLSELNITVKNQGFEIHSANVVLRKLYEII